MSRKLPEVPKPTAAELEILSVLWRLGGATVREVHEALERDAPVMYTTVLKLLQIMADKGLVKREEKGRAHVYQASRRQEETQKQMVQDLLQRAFGGSAKNLVLRALDEQPASREEIAEIRELLDRMEKKGER